MNLSRRLAPAPTSGPEAEAFRKKSWEWIDKGFNALDEKKLAKCSAYQLIIIIGVLKDKLRDMDIRPPDEQKAEIKFPNRGAMMEYLAGRSLLSLPSPSPEPIHAKIVPPEPAPELEEPAPRRRGRPPGPRPPPPPPDPNEII